MAGLLITAPVLLGLMVVLLHREVGVQTASTTCYHCYWIDIYGEDTTGPGFRTIDMLSGEGANTRNCQNSLNLVPTIQCDGDCFTHEFTTTPHINADKGFVHYIARTCSAEENPFPSSFTSVQRDACVDGRDYYDSEGSQEGSLCRCSGDLCNNQATPALNTITTCFVCSVKIVNGIIERDYRPGYEGSPTDSCLSPESGVIPAIQCPSDCYVKYETYTVVSNNESVQRVRRGCHSDYDFSIDSNTCKAVVENDPEIVYDVHRYCRCSGNECDPENGDGNGDVTSTPVTNTDGNGGVTTTITNTDGNGGVTTTKANTDGDGNGEVTGIPSMTDVTVTTDGNYEQTTRANVELTTKAHVELTTKAHVEQTAEASVEETTKVTGEETTKVTGEETTKVTGEETTQSKSDGSGDGTSTIRASLPLIMGSLLIMVSIIRQL